jgi:uncharacterized membrane protein
VGSGTPDPVIEIQAAPDTPPGTYVLTISGEAEGMIKSTTMSVAVVEKANRIFLPMVENGAAP